MSYTVTTFFSEEQAKLEGTFPIDMYVINTSQTGWSPYYFVNMNEDVYGYGMDSSGDLTAVDTVYTRGKIERGQVSTNTTGEISEVSISVSNVDRVMESLIQNNNYLRGCDIYLITTFAKFLPTGTTYKHIGSSPDKNSIIKEKLYIDSTLSNEQIITFSCKPKFTLKNIVLPRRRFSRECFWNLDGDYLGSTCDPESSINSVTYPTCDGTLEQCKERGNEARYGGFPGIPSRGIWIV